MHLKTATVYLDIIINKIFTTYKERKEIEKYSHIASYEEVKENEYNLNIPRYVDTFEEEEQVDMKEVASKIESLEKELEDVSISKADEDKEMHDELAKLMQQRENYASKIKKSTYMKYERVRAHRHNIGIASVKDEVCNGCYMHIPPQLYVEVKKDLDVHTCPHCQRILYYIPPKQTDETKK